MNGSGDVLLLCGLVAADEKKQEPCSSLRVVDPLTGSDIDLEFGDTIGEVSVLAGIAIDQSINADQDSGSARAIPEGVDPIAILISLLDTHAEV